MRAMIGHGTEMGGDQKAAILAEAILA
jgi:hypothetical protein